MVLILAAPADLESGGGCVEFEEGRIITVRCHGRVLRCVGQESTFGRPILRAAPPENCDRWISVRARSQ